MLLLQSDGFLSELSEVTAFAKWGELFSNVGGGLWPQCLVSEQIGTPIPEKLVAMPRHVEDRHGLSLAGRQIGG